MVYKTLVIGIGSIGGLKDNKYDSPKGEAILTHCHSITKHPKFNLQAIMDIDNEKARKASKKWDCMGCTILDAIDKNNIDVVVIATPTETHYRVYSQIKDWNLKAIIMEKPCGNDFDICNAMKDDKRIIVNYTRRFLPYYRQLKEELKNIKILSCVIHYVRGLMRDGCHAIDLCRYFFGEILEVKKLSTGTDDYSPDDTTDCVWMKTERCPNIIMVPGDGRIADCFDFEIMTEKSMVCLYDHGSNVFFRKVDKEKVYGNYNALYGKPENINIPINFGRTALMAFYDHVHEFINGCDPICTINDALEVHRIIKKVRNKPEYKTPSIMADG